MPRDLFGDLTRPSVSVGARKWYTVPMSFAAHVAAIVPLVLVPLLASDVLPRPHEDRFFVPIAPPPPEPPRPPQPQPRIERAPSNANAAPLEAPDRIAPEPPASFDMPDAVDLGPGAVPGAGTVVTEPTPPPPAAPSQRPREPVRVGDLVRPPVKVHDIAPAYPQMALAARLEGLVILEAVIDADGRVQDVRLLRSSPLFDQAALEAVRQWRYTPSTYNGAPVRVVMTVTVNFSLKKP